MKNLLFLLLTLVFLSCAPSEEYTEAFSIPDIEAEELIDIQINKEGIVRINGRSIQESAIASHIESFNIDSTTSIRMILHEEAHTGTVNKITRSLALINTSNSNLVKLKTRMLSQEEFDKYLNDEIHIDVLSNNRVLYNGYELFTEDIKTALDSESNIHKPVFLAISDNATFGQVLDVQKQIRLASFNTVHW